MQIYLKRNSVKVSLLILHFQLSNKELTSVILSFLVHPIDAIIAVQTVAAKINFLTIFIFLPQFTNFLL